MIFNESSKSASVHGNETKYRMLNLQDVLNITFQQKKKKKTKKKKRFIYLFLFVLFFVCIFSGKHQDIIFCSCL